MTKADVKTESVTIELANGETVEVIKGDVLFYVSETSRYVCKAVAEIITDRFPFQPLPSKHWRVIFNLEFIAGSRKSFTASNEKLTIETGKPRPFTFLFNSEREAIEYAQKENKNMIEDRLYIAASYSVTIADRETVKADKENENDATKQNLDNR